MKKELQSAVPFSWSERLKGGKSAGAESPDSHTAKTRIMKAWQHR